MRRMLQSKNGATELRGTGILNRSVMLLLLSLVAVAASAGCGRSNNASVSGQVTLDGNPLRRGTVGYHPTEQGPVAYSGIDEDGRYEVKTGNLAGLVAGDYVVTVVAIEGVIDPAAAGNQPPQAGRLLTPVVYRNKATSPLRYLVSTGSNEIDIALNSP